MVRYIALRLPPTVPNELFPWTIDKMTVDSMFARSKNMTQIERCVRNTIESGIGSKRVLVQVSTLQSEHPSEGIEEGVDILVLTGCNFRHFDPISNAWVGTDDVVFRSVLPPVVVVCLSCGARETG